MSGDQPAIAKQGASDFLQKIGVPIVASLTLACLGATGNMYVQFNRLQAQLEEREQQQRDAQTQLAAQAAQIRTQQEDILRLQFEQMRGSILAMSDNMREFEDRISRLESRL